MKDPYFAGVLNIVPGLGYLYLGTRKVFAALLLAGTVIGVMDMFLDPNIAMYDDIPATTLSYLTQLCMSAAFIYDAYSIAKKEQRKTKKSK